MNPSENNSEHGEDNPESAVEVGSVESNPATPDSGAVETTPVEEQPAITSEASTSPASTPSALDESGMADFEDDLSDDDLDANVLIRCVHDDSTPEFRGVQNMDLSLIHI